MPQDLYGDEPTATEQKPSSTPDTPSQESTEKDTETRTEILPSSICPGMKPGDEMILKIVRVHDDSYEVAYAPEPKKGEGEEEQSEPESAPMPEQMGGGNYE